MSVWCVCICLGSLYSTGRGLLFILYVVSAAELPEPKRIDLQVEFQRLYPSLYYIIRFIRYFCLFSIVSAHVCFEQCMYRSLYVLISHFVLNPRLWRHHREIAHRKQIEWIVCIGLTGVYCSYFQFIHFIGT